MKNNKSKRLIVTTGDELHKKIKDKSEKLGISASDFVRMAVNEKLMREGN